jgi:uncharacterized membrane protein (DUF4010 family)
MNLDATLLLHLLVALSIGLLIGAERERRKGSGPNRAAAGLRTFALVSLLGGLAAAIGGEALLVAGAVTVGAFAVLSYLRSRDDDPGLTTEVALATTYLLGVLAIGQPALAGAIAVGVAALLATKRSLHRFVSSVLTEQELQSALMLLAAAIVILPMTPDHVVGPFGVLNPRTIWRLAVLVMTIGAAGHIGGRLFGAKWGLPLSGFASGFVSSSATIGVLGSRSRREPALMSAAVAGATLSTVATVVQMIAVLAATSSPVLAAVLVPLLAGGAMALAWGAIFTLRSLRAQGLPEIPPGHAFEIRTALLFAATISAVLLLSAAIEQYAGVDALAIAAGVAGFADTHAPAISVASLVAGGKLNAASAVVPILAALTTNTMTKMILAAMMGGRRFALQVIPGLILVIVAIWGAAAFLGRVPIFV